MSFDRKSIESLAAEYAAPWNTGFPRNVAAYFAEKGEIVINRGGASSCVFEISRYQWP
jgi:hypothetical protein